MNHRLLLLALCQGLFLTNNVAFLAVNGLVGLRLAPDPALATLPIMGYVVGGALFTALVAKHQRTWGRKRAFQVGLIMAIISTALCGWAASLGSFWLLTAATVLAGYYNANAGLYRFAATELAPASHKERAISWVLAGGIIGAIAGPALASATQHTLPVSFAGTYVALAGVAALGLTVMSFLHFPPMPQPSALHPGRPLREIARQPAFIASVSVAALSYGVMTLLMSATPLAMAQCSLDFPSTALVLEWHVLGMFVPGFFTGALIKRFGAPAIMASGLALYLVCILVALAGVDLPHFLAALLALGVGWNFLYVGSTTLFTTTYRPEEKTGAQGAMDFCVYVAMAITSLASGALVATQGWTCLNLGSLLPAAAITGVLLWNRAGRSHPAPGAS